MPSKCFGFARSEREFEVVVGSAIAGSVGESGGGKRTIEEEVKEFDGDRSRQTLAVGMLISYWYASFHKMNFRKAIGRTPVSLFLRTIDQP